MTEKKRLSWLGYFCKLLMVTAERSPCLKRKIGAIIVDDESKRVLSMGYNGAPPGVINCSSRGVCFRKDFKSGENLEDCKAVHAEQNALMQLLKYGINMNGMRLTLYCTHKPCNTCMKLIVAAGIKKVKYLEDYPSDSNLLYSNIVECELIDVEGMYESAK